jgi:hypothetical protein
MIKAVINPAGKNMQRMCAKCLMNAQTCGVSSPIRQDLCQLTTAPDLDADHKDRHKWQQRKEERETEREKDGTYLRTTKEQGLYRR